MNPLHTTGPRHLHAKGRKPVRDAVAPARLQRLIARFDHDGEAIPRRAAASLARLGSAAIPVLRAELRHSRSARRRRWAVHTLSQIPARSVIQDLELALRDPNMSVRLHAALGVERMPAPALTKSLVALVRDPSGGVRVNAISVLARLNERGASSAILGALRDSKGYVRLAALRAAASMQLRIPSRLLAGLAEDPRSGIQRLARTLQSDTG